MLKKGQRVQINSGGEEFGGFFDGVVGSIFKDSGDGTYIVGSDVGRCARVDESYLAPVEPSIDNLMVGDVVENKKGNQIKVTFIGNDEFIVGYSDNIDKGLSFMTKLSLNNEGYKVISPKPTMTIQEAEEKLNATIIKE